VEFAAQGITVNNVPPGFVDTPMLRASEALVSAGSIEKTAAASPMKRPGRPEDIAAACAFLASEDAGYITGHTLSVQWRALFCISDDDHRHTGPSALPSGAFDNHRAPRGGLQPMDLARTQAPRNCV